METLFTTADFENYYSFAFIFCFIVSSVISSIYISKDHLNKFEGFVLTMIASVSVPLLAPLLIIFGILYILYYIITKLFVGE